MGRRKAAPLLEALEVNMKNYRVLLLGENYFIPVDGKNKMMGYKTCFVEAENPEKAIEKAVTSIRNDKKLSSSIKNKFWHKKPMIFSEELNEIEKEEMENKHGYTWFPMGG